MSRLNILDNQVFKKQLSKISYGAKLRVYGPLTEKLLLEEQRKRNEMQNHYHLRKFDYERATSLGQGIQTLLVTLACSLCFKYTKSWFCCDYTIILLIRPNLMNLSMSICFVVSLDTLPKQEELPPPHLPSSGGHSLVMSPHEGLV